MNSEIQKNLRYNITVNLLDGAFFGFALGFASFVTIIPLFVSTMTTSAILIGLIPAIHSVGWQLPQLLLANRVARQVRLKPMVLAMTIHERLPFIGLAFVAGYLSKLGVNTALTITFLLLSWQGLGGGLAANPWQSMISKIIPSDMRGTFFGGQASAANLLASVAAILAGIILEKLSSPYDYVLCFLLAAAGMLISYGFLSLTREPASPPVEDHADTPTFWSAIGVILRNDRNFRWFLLGRSLLAFATMAFAFYTVYAVNYYKVSEGTIGVMTSVLMGTQIAANPLMGWLGDRWNRRYVIEIGLGACIASAVISWWAPSAGWFYLVFILAGLGNVAMWTVSLAMILEFGKDNEKPAYIGLANTLIAPTTIVAPFIGGWLADTTGYHATFIFTAISGLLTLAVFQWLVKDPQPARLA
jgi:MFS family permease